MPYVLTIVQVREIALYALAGRLIAQASQPAGNSGREVLWNGYLATPTAPGPDPMPPTLDEGVVLAVAKVELPPVTVPESV